MAEMGKVTARKICTWLAAMLWLAVLPGCSPDAGADNANATLTALRASVAGTATAVALGGNSTNTLGTAQAEATEKSLAIEATQTARASTRSEAQLAEATVAAPIVAELPQYGLEPGGGHVGWVHDPLTLEITGYQQFTYGNDHPEVTAADFALAADITWDTQYGSSGCGYMFRSDGDKNKPNQYMVIATRFGNGHVIFTALAEGEIANIHDFYPKSADQSFQWENGTTNRLAVVARGALIEIYTNGVKIGEVDTSQPPSRLPAPPKPRPPADKTNQDLVSAYEDQLKEYEDIVKQSENSYQVAMGNYMKSAPVFEEGFLAMIAASESGRTVCTFSDAWLWQIDTN